MTYDLNGNVVLVAGASSGMGRAISVAAGRAGAHLALVARRGNELAEVARQIEADGGKALAITCDAANPAEVGAAVSQALDQFGRVDVAVNCVGTNIPRRSLDELTFDSWHELIRANLDPAFALTQAVLPAFRRQRKGLLIHISSVAAKWPDLSGAGYQASKAGVAALAHATMAEERDNGVRVTVLYPGFTDTPLVEKRPTPPSADELANALQPEDVAGVCLAVMALPDRAYVPELVLRPIH